MRLIDADKLKWCKILKPCMNDMISACIKEIDIKDIPAVDAVPMAPVKIERYDNGQGRCPLCKTDIPFQVVNDKWAFEPYCPHCGAKMDLEG